MPDEGIGTRAERRFLTNAPAPKTQRVLSSSFERSVYETGGMLNGKEVATSYETDISTPSKPRMSII